MNEEKVTATMLDARVAWNEGAAAYSQFVESGADYYRLLVHGPALLAACSNVRGCRVLDVGCGQGYFSRLLARAGASVTAFDLSDKLIARALELEKHDALGIRYEQLDAATIGEHFAPGSFDLVTGCMSLQDMGDPGLVLQGVSTVLQQNGRAVFSVPHPCTDPPVRIWQRDGDGRKLALCLDRYFDSGPAICHWNMPRLKSFWSTPFHRLTLTEWSRLISRAGFLIRSIAEPRPEDELFAAHPQLEDCARMPYFLIFALGKQP